ncbi:MAG: AraC family transcriptional regulator [Flavobacteriaceae bacterium]|nr:AraC family transcriptional regulator [Flavobacteriaceae bacterium]
MLESINVAANASLKVETYSNNNHCESAGWHIHPEFELVYIKNGSGVLNIGSKKRVYNNGTLVFLGGNIPHADFGNRDNADNQEIVVQFKKEFLEEKLKVFPELLKIKELIQKSKQVLIFDSDVQKKLWPDFKKFCHLDHQGKLINLLYILDLLSKESIHKTLFDTLSTANFKKNEIKRLEEVFMYVNAHYAKDISVTEISSQLGLTPNSFCRFFKKMTQRTFIDFVNEFRINKALEFFNENNTFITEVMYRSGFNNPSYFSRQFKKYQGHTPSNYLKNRYADSFS